MTLKVRNGPLLHGLLGFIVGGTACNNTPPPPTPNEVMDLSKPDDGRRFHRALVHKASRLLNGSEAMRVLPHYTETCADDECSWPLEDRLAKIQRGEYGTPDFQMNAATRKGGDQVIAVGGDVGRSATFDCSWFEDSKKSEERVGRWLYTTCEFPSGAHEGLGIMRLASGYVWVGSRDVLAAQRQKAKKYRRDGVHVEISGEIKGGKAVTKTIVEPSRVQPKKSAP